MHCTNCNINWARLLACDIEDGESIDVCPVCLTDSFITESIDAGVYFKCAVTGKVLNMDTKQELVLYKPVIEKATRERPAMTETKAAQEERELQAILSYQRTGNKGDYFNGVKK